MGVDWFNSDDRAAQLNAGSYRNTPVHVRSASGKQPQRFIDSHIDARRSFAFENALRTDAAFQQILRAKEMGFLVLMDYIAAGPVEEHIRRVMNRAALGGHSASEQSRDIYEHSMKNLLTAFEENRRQRIDLLRIFAQSVFPKKKTPELKDVREYDRRMVALSRMLSLLHRNRPKGKIFCCLTMFTSPARLSSRLRPF